MDHMDYIDVVSTEDIKHLREKHKTYQGSWKKRGGSGAWLMAARKIDRLEHMLANLMMSTYDVFGAIAAEPDGSDGTVLAEIRDLRRYLLLIESEMVARGVVDLPEKSDSLSDETKKIFNEYIKKEIQDHQGEPRDWSEDKIASYYAERAKKYAAKNTKGGTS